MNEREGCLQLYLAAFPDETPASAKRLFDLFFDSDCLYTLEAGRPVSMLFLLDMTFAVSGRNLPVCYIYGAATHPQYRRQGRMKALLLRAAEVARARGAKAVYLLPASEQLAAYYASLGFTGRFYHTCRIFAGATGQADIAVLSREEYRRRAAERLPDGAIWPSEAFFGLVFAEAVASGGGAFGDKDGSLLCQRQGEMLFALEAFGDLSDAFLASLLRRTGAKKALLRGPALRGGARQTFGLYLPLGEDFAGKTGYFGLARDL